MCACNFPEYVDFGYSIVQNVGDWAPENIRELLVTCTAMTTALPFSKRNGARGIYPHGTRQTRPPPRPNISILPHNSATLFANFPTRASHRANPFTAFSTHFSHSLVPRTFVLPSFYPTQQCFAASFAATPTSLFEDTTPHRSTFPFIRRSKPSSPYLSYQPHPMTLHARPRSRDWQRLVSTVL